MPYGKTAGGNVDITGLWETAFLFIILFLTVVRTMNRCNPSIYAGYSDFGFRNEIW